jgi:hypothetical protein
VDADLDELHHAPDDHDFGFVEESLAAGSGGGAGGLDVAAAHPKIELPVGAAGAGADLRGAQQPVGVLVGHGQREGPIGRQP